MIRYCPLPSVMAVRVFSMSAGLAASTVTPGSTAPDGSLTVPVREACANTVAGRRKTTRIDRHFAKVRIPPVLLNPEDRTSHSCELCTAATRYRKKVRIVNKQVFIEG